MFVIYYSVCNYNVMVLFKSGSSPAEGAIAPFLVRLVKKNN